MLLRDLQSEFAETISDSSHANIPAYLQIYRNNYLSVLASQLKDTYPLTLLLLGEECFNHHAWRYIAQYPSCDGDLNNYGEYLHVYLDNCTLSTDYPYLSEVARFEWCCRIIYFAAEDQAQTKMSFQYPILDIIDFCHGKSDDILQLNPRPTYLNISRVNHNIKLLTITKDEFI
jgi:hypothetical protein